MFKSVLFLALFLCVNGIQKYNPRRAGYCSKRCNTNVKATGCICKLLGAKTELLDNMVEFRQVIVDEHNYYRNLVASGNETRGFTKAAADMMIMNYDMELEFLARCHARYTFRANHDRCKVLKNCRKAVQNIAGYGAKNESLKMVKELIRLWYDQVKDMQEDNYLNYPRCARVYSSDTKEDKYINPNYNTALICDYAMKDIKGNMLFGKPMYTQGPPCSKCPKKKKYNKCNTKYTSLCGELETVPTDKPFDFKSRAPKHKSIPIVIFIALFEVCLF
ncbi:venom allergen 5-like isoform X2 [Tribolium madens]|uniref:venom allergen 5-like isoform X2 n=1 Tax=Tribolium madens TaxID=41895 RepID=UPI001CF71FA5|nr:venom allergen 5-like isoform X2 [Tribolium madens]